MLNARIANRLFVSLLAGAASTIAAIDPAAAAGRPSSLAGPSGSVVHQAQLPRTVTPVRYTIAVVPDAQTLSFTGTVAIALDVQSPTRTITLNAVDLQIESATLDGSSATKAISFDTDRQTATFAFAAPVAAGRHVLHIAYRGKINQSSQGLFALDYDTPQGKRRMLATQFEAVDARRFVPCFDEPDMKSVFDISVTAPVGQMVVSNMPIAHEDSVAGGLKRVSFQPSPKMSSYLMYLGIGDMERIHQTVDGVDVGVIVRKGAAEQGRYALDAAVKILRYYNDYFGIRFPLPKLDLIGGPGAGGFGAMENWGAIFYFENDLLIDPRTASDADRQNVYTTIAHEMAHQWFGDLVTMGWWDDLWLNEGFASWMENRAVDAIHPEWSRWLQFAANRESAFGTDALKSTHPVVEQADTVDQINRIGDAITYEKGASVIRMIEAYAGSDAFRTGIRAYLAAHAYGNASTADLLRSVQTSSGKPILDIGQDFIRQSGVPLIRESGTAGSLALSQGRFALDPESRTPQTWHVPVIAEPLGNPADRRRLVVTGATPMPLPAPESAPMIVNAGQTGYFRTLYTPDQLTALSTRFAQVPAADQLGLLSDSWALATSGDTDVGGFLRLARSLPTSADPIVWQRLAAMLTTIDRLYAPGAPRAAYRDYARKLLATKFADVGFDARSGEADNVGLLRTSLIAALSRLEDGPVVMEARRRFTRLVTDPSSDLGATRRAIIAAAAENADQATFDDLRHLARTTTDALEKQRLDLAMASARDPAILKQVLALILGDEIPVTTGPRMLYVAATADADLTWTFATANRALFESRLDSLQRYSLYARIAASSGDLSRADQLQAFADKYIPVSGRQDVYKAEDVIHTSARLRRDVVPQIDRWIAADGGR
jgi:aminopeptidase N